MKKYILSLIFISLLLLILAFVALGNLPSRFKGWSFSTYKKESTNVEELELKIKELESRLDNTSVSPNNKEVEKKDIKMEQTVSEPIFKEKVVYIEKPIVNNVENVSTESQGTVIKSDISNSGVSIVYSYISQGKYKDYYGNEYGSILLGVRISTDKDIYIPQTTTDSSGSNIGFSYSIEGGFVGERNSEVKCSLKSEGYCKIQAGSTEKEMTVNVWIYPEDPGEYSANFKKLGYKYAPKGVMNYLDINKVAEPLYIDY